MGDIAVQSSSMENLSENKAWATAYVFGMSLAGIPNILNGTRRLRVRIRWKDPFASHQRGVIVPSVRRGKIFKVKDLPGWNTCWVVRSLYTSRICVTFTCLVANHNLVRVYHWANSSRNLMLTHLHQIRHHAVKFQSFLFPNRIRMRNLKGGATRHTKAGRKQCSIPKLS